MSLKSACGAGWRAGRAEPGIVLIDGHKYIESPVCPFTGWRFVSRFLWHQGYYNGIMQRLKKGTL